MLLNYSIGSFCLLKYFECLLWFAFQFLGAVLFWKELLTRGHLSIERLQRAPPLSFLTSYVLPWASTLALHDTQKGTSRYYG